MTDSNATSDSPAPVADSPIVSLGRPVVSTQWLADHLGSPDLVVLDASVLVVPGFDGRYSYLTGEDQYLINGHIEGAVFADLLESGLSEPDARFAFTRPSAATFEAAASALGIDRSTTVIVYDSAVGQWAARVWWLFRSFGYDGVAVLDGGLTAWRAEARETVTGHVEPRSGHTFTAVERPESWVDKADVEAIVAGTATGALVCAAPPKEFSGAAGQRPRLGHIPGSSSVPASRLVDREANTILPRERLTELFAPALESDRIVLYCGGGVAAAADALALTLLGRDDIAVYDGSLAEWAADADAPLVVEPAA